MDPPIPPTNLPVSSPRSRAAAVAPPSGVPRETNNNNKLASFVRTKEFLKEAKEGRRECVRSFF